ncbi:transcription termination factor, mitochondrial-like [Ischnura elegans]|uniref:transcription termination factor, mitochondrial-like n=1 Tax=Ischnura elegans TaxID=197161 RepID=UPI001ED8BFC8|nr:transcription termination factor, mitochondrial-like [Ischnura elegans]
MLVKSSARLLFVSCGNIKTLCSSNSRVIKTYFKISPKLNIWIHEEVYVRFMSKSNTILGSPDSNDDKIEGESKHEFGKLPWKENIARLMECTGCIESVAILMLREYPILKHVSSSEISRAVKFLIEEGVPMDTITMNCWLLTESEDSLRKKVAVLAKIGIHNYEAAFPLLRYSVKQLNKTLSWCHADGQLDKTKLSYLCERLKCDPADIALAVSTHSFLLTVPFERMSQILEILLDAGVPPSRILRDMWVFRYRVEKVQERVQIAREGGIKQFKTWMVRCTDKILSTTIRLQAEKRALLGPHKDSMVDYLSSRLNISKEEAQVVLERQPQLQRMGAAKLCNTLDFLLGKDGDSEMSPKFDPGQISSSSRILCHSLETMKARHARLIALGHEPKNPIILYKARRKFEDFVLKLEKQASEKAEEAKNLESGVKSTNDMKETSVNG